MFAEPILSVDGRYLFFNSDRAKSGNDSQWQIYRLDLATNVRKLVTADSAGNPQTVVGSAGCRLDGVSADGRFVLFWSSSPKLVDGRTDGGEFLRDMQTGVTQRFAAKLSGSYLNTAYGSGPSRQGLSEDAATGLVIASTSSFGLGSLGWQLLAVSRNNGTAALASSTASGSVAPGFSTSIYLFRLSSDGTRAVMAPYYAPNLDPARSGRPSGANMYSKNFATGALTLISWDPGKQEALQLGAFPGANPVSADGRYVALNITGSSTASGFDEIYLKDAVADAKVWSSEQEGTIHLACRPSVSADGKLIAFVANEKNASTNRKGVYVKNLTTGQLQLVYQTPASSGALPSEVDMSADGKVIAYSTGANGGGHDIYVSGSSATPVPTSWQVTATAGSNGTISPSGTQTVQSGASAIFTATPNTGFTVGQWLVDGVLRQSGGTSFTLANVAANHAVQVTFTPVTVQSGAVRVTLQPTNAVTAGALWQVDGGPWQVSGTTLTQLSVGAHVVSFKPVAGYDTPSHVLVSVTAAQTLALVVSYTAPGFPVITPVYLPDYPDSRIAGVSGDGTAIIGTASRPGGVSGFEESEYQAFQASFGGAAGLPFALGFLPQDSVSSGTAISADGFAVVGYGSDAAFLRDGQPAALKELAVLPDHWESAARGVCAGGTFVVGSSRSAGLLGSAVTHAVFWGGTGSVQPDGSEPTDLGVLTGYDDSIAYGVSAFPPKIVGYNAQFTGSVNSDNIAFAWEPPAAQIYGQPLQGTMRSLRRPDGDTASLALAVSSDGSTAVGASGAGTIFADGFAGAIGATSGRINERSRAAYWKLNQGDQITLLDLPAAGAYSVATAVSANGGVIVGSGGVIDAQGRYASVAGVWSIPDNKVYILQTLLQNAGANLVGWSNLYEATGISSDGDVVVGYGRRTDGSEQGFRVSGLRQALYGAGAVRILEEPQNVSSPAGRDVTLRVSATGSGTIGYQWMKNGTPLAGQTGSTLTLTSVNANTTGAYTVAVANLVGPGVVSSPAIVSVSAVPGAPVITVHPQSVTVAYGSDVTLTVAATGNNLSYSWQYLGIDDFWYPLPPQFPGNPSSLLISNVRGDIIYRAVVRNDVDVVFSQPAVITVLSLADALEYPFFDHFSQGASPWFPQKVTTHDGSDAVQSALGLGHNQVSALSVDVYGPGTLSFWWKVSSEPNRDKLHFQVNGIDAPSVSPISGQTNWQQVTVHLTEGSHTLAWVYKKDGALSVSQDAGWVDEVNYLPDFSTITLTASPPTGGTVYLDRGLIGQIPRENAAETASGPGQTAQETFMDGMYLGAVATPASGYAFVGWVEDGQVVSTSQGYYFFIDGDRSLIATFVPARPNLTATILPGRPAPIVVSTVPGATSDSALLPTTQPLYLSCGYKNSGTAATNFVSYMTLEVDGQERITVPVSQGLEPDGLGELASVNIGQLSPGVHLAKLILDTTDTVSESDETDNSYTRLFVVTSNNADLGSLVPSAGTLTPTFAPAVLNYAVTVPNLTSSISIIPHVVELDATVRVNNVLVTSGTSGSPINLAVGTNSIVVRTTAPDGSTMKTYTLVVTRANGISGPFNGSDFIVAPNVGISEAYDNNGFNITASGFSIVGERGSGTLIHTGGTHTVPQLRVGNFAGSSGRYVLSSGTVAVSGQSVIGSESSGTMEQTGGTHSSGALTLGNLSGSTGNYSLGAGAILNVTGYSAIGREGTGVFTQSGGAHNVNALELGQYPTGTGTYSMSAGTMTLNGINVGVAGAGQFHVSGTADIDINGDGTGGVGSMTLGYSSGGHGTWTQTGGTITIGGYLFSGLGGGGTWHHNGGTLTARSLRLGWQSGSTGSFILNGGTANFDSVETGSGTGALALSKGTLNVISTNLNLGASGLVVGNGTDATTLYLGNGAHTIANGVHVKTNAVLTIEGGTFTAFPIALEGGTLRTDTAANLGALTATSGSLLDPGQLGVKNTKVAGLQLAAGATYAADLYEISGCDKVTVTGAATLANATLNARLRYAPASPTTFMIVVNDGTDPIGGTFAGLPEGSLFDVTNRGAGGGTFQAAITYQGSTGNDVVVTLLPALPTVATSAPSDITRTTATLNGTVNPNGVTLSTVQFAYGLSPGSLTSSGSVLPAAPAKTGTSAVPVSLPITGLTPHTTYHIQLRGTNALGTNVTSDSSFTTLNSLPIATDDLEYIVTGGNSITIPVLANDSDPDGDQLTLVAATSTMFGSATISGNDISYRAGVTPGTDTFQYTVSDGFGGTASGTITVMVLKPVAPVLTVGVRTQTPAPGAGEAGGPPAGSVLSTLGEPALSDRGQLVVRVTLAAGRKKLQGIYVEESTQAGSLPALQGELAPGFPFAPVTFKSFADPVIAPNGAIAFHAKIQGKGVRVNNDEGVWTNLFGSTLELVLREGNDVPGLPSGAKLKSVTSLSVRDGELVALLKLSPAKGIVSATNDTVLWRMKSPETGTLLLRERTLVDVPDFGFNMMPSTVSVFQPGRGAPGHGRSHGDGAIVARITWGEAFQSLLKIESDDTTVYLIDTFGSELVSGFTTVGPPATSPSGQQFVAAVKRHPRALAPEALICYDGGYWQTVVDSGFPAPVLPDDACTFVSFSDPVVNSNSQVAFQATLKKQTSKLNGKAGLFYGFPSGDGYSWTLSLAARLGSPATDEDGAPIAAVWNKFISYALPDHPNGAGVIFLAETTKGDTTAKNKTALWGLDSEGKLRRLLRTGDRITIENPDSSVATLTISKLALLNALPRSFGVARSYNAQGSVALVATFTDKTQALIRIDIP